MNLSQTQREILVDFIVSEPNTQTPLAIIAKCILDLAPPTKEVK